MPPHKKDRLLPTVLMVEDAAGSLVNMADTLRRELAGCHVILVSSGAEALEIAEARPVDCAVIGVTPPLWEGTAICRRLKAGSSTEGFPVLLAACGELDGDARAAGFEAGAEGFLPHNFSPVELLAKLRVMLRIKRAEQELRDVNRRLAGVAEERSRKLQETELRYRMLFDACDNAVLLFEVTGDGEGGRVLGINPAACQWLGYSPEEATRLTLRNLSAPDRMRNLQGRMESILQHRQLSFDTVLNARDGRPVPLHVTAGVVDTEEGRAVLAVGRRPLAGAQAPRYFLADQTGHVVYDCNVKTGEIRWGGAVAQVTGYSPEEITRLVWRRWQRRVHPDDRPRVMARLREALDSVGKYQMEYRILHKSGEARYIEDAGVALPGEDGRAVRVLGTMRDITERVRAQEERRRLEHELRHSQRLESLGVLAGGIAHDFNNILAGIIGLTDLALRDIPPESRTHEDLREALQAAHRAKELVRQILAFSRQTGEERAPLYLHVIAREALKLLRASLSSEIEIIDSVDVHSGAVLANAAQMHQVVMNYCTNAAQAMAKKGGRLEMRVEDAEVDARMAANHPRLHVGPYVHLSVHDTGHGMSEAVLERVFDPFFTTKGPGEGTGMGLAVVHGIVSSHGGAVKAESRVGAGSAFHVWLPRVGGVVVEPDHAVRHDIPGGDERVLFVDDDEAVLRFADLALPRLGFTVTLCRGGDEAWALFSHAPGSFDLVITDQVMPGMTGIEFAARVTQKRPGLPVILFTGYSEPVRQAELDAAGIVNVMIKPVTVNDLAAEIRRVMDAQVSGGAAG